MNNFCPFFLNTHSSYKKWENFFFLIFIFSGARVWGLWQNNAISLSKHLTTHIDRIVLLFANHSQKWPILKNRKLKKI